MVDLLFVYGSLIDSQNEYGLYLQHNATYFSDGFVYGRLYDAGEYPGMVLDAKGYKVKGKIYCLNDIDKQLQVLDDYEGYGEEQLQPNLFIRQQTIVATSNGSIKCWIYIYNLPVTSLHEITTGDYAAYKNP